jgi:hypothetical protein
MSNGFTRPFGPVIGLKKTLMGILERFLKLTTKGQP